MMVYEPFESLKDYYEKVIVFNKSFTKPQTKQQIAQALKDINQTIEGDEKTQSSLTSTLLKLSKNTLQ